LALIAAWALILGSDRVLHAQVPEQPMPAEPAPADTVVTPAFPNAIPASQIVRRADADTDTLSQIRAQIAAKPAVSAIDTLLPTFADSVRKLAAPLADSELLSVMSARDLTDLEQRWRGFDTQIRSWQSTLEDRTAVLVALNSTVARLREAWDATAELAFGTDILPELVDRVLTMQDQITAVEKDLGSRRDQLLTLESRVSVVGATIQTSIAGIDSARAVARQQILAPDSPAIWKVARSARRDLQREIALSWKLRSASLRDFVTTNEQALLIHAVFFFALVSLTVMLRRRTRDWDTADPSTAAASYVLSRPVASGLLIALLLYRLFYERIPTTVSDLVGVLAVLPLVRLLPGLLPDPVRRPILVIVGIFAISRLTPFLIEGSLLYRIAVLVVNAIALLWFLRVNSKGLPESLRGKPLWNAYLGLVRLAAVLLLVALLANVVGFLALSSLLMTGVLNSAFLSVVLLAAVKVLEGIAVAAVRRGPIRVLRTVRTYPDLVLARITNLLRLVGVVAFVGLMLHQFGILQPVIATVDAILSSKATVGTWKISLGDVLAFVLTIWLAVLVSRLLRFLLREDVLSRMRLPRGMPHSISTMAHYVILGIGFLIACAAAGLDLNKFALLAGAFGVGIGFGLQNIVNNFISGLILTFERQIQIGDTIEIDSLVGIVKRIGIRASYVRTFSGAEVIVPNGDLIAGRVVNWTLSDQLRRIELPIGVAYGNRPAHVIEVLLEVAKGHEEILDNPEPVVLFNGFGESSLDFEMRVWTANFDFWRRVSSDVAAQAYDALAEAGIEIPFPQRDLHIKSVEVSAADALAARRADEPDEAPQI
jgi:small-conductance mechanosensitive channel